LFIINIYNYSSKQLNVLNDKLNADCLINKVKLAIRNTKLHNEDEDLFSLAKIK